MFVMAIIFLRNYPKYTTDLILGALYRDGHRLE